jgi:hypothetical protein
MAVLVRDCAHCKTKSVSFTIPASFHLAGHKDQFTGLALCGACGMPVAFWAVTPGIQELPTNQNGNIEKAHYLIAGLWPELTSTDIPSDLPKPVERALMQANRNFDIADNEDAAAIKYRKALENAFVEAYPSVKGRLIDRIDKLQEEHLITPALAEWAHEIRMIGNEGAHEIEGVARDDLENVRAFTDATLRYLFTLPAQVRKRKLQA